MCDEEVEVIDLDELEKDMEEEFEEDDEEESEWTSDGVNKVTGKYDPEHDAWYPNFDALAQAERELFGKRSF